MIAFLSLFCFVLIGYHFLIGYMSKFIQRHFFHHSTFSLPTKQKGGKLIFFLFPHFSNLPPFSILPLFHSSNQTNPKYFAPPDKEEKQNKRQFLKENCFLTKRKLLSRKRLPTHNNTFFFRKHSNWPLTMLSCTY